MNCLSKGKVVIVLLLLIFIISCICVPAGADRAIATSTKVFFEKNGQPYNGTVEFTVTCYGFTYTYSDPDSKKYLNGDYKKRPPGSDNQTEVFSYHATVDQYGDEIFEPFYLNHRVIDYCSLCGETDGKKFYIEYAGDSPIPDCSRRDQIISFSNYDRDSDLCYLTTDESKSCHRAQDELRMQERELCDQYLEEFDMKKLYPPDTRTLEIGGVTMVVTPEYDACHEQAGSIDLNCTSYMEEVACANYCDPDKNPLERDCVLHYEIPADDEGNIIESTPKPDETYTYNSEDRDLSGGGFNLLSLLYELFMVRGQ